MRVILFVCQATRIVVASSGLGRMCWLVAKSNHLCYQLLFLVCGLPAIAVSNHCTCSTLKSQHCGVKAIQCTCTVTNRRIFQQNTLFVALSGAYILDNLTA